MNNTTSKKKPFIVIVITVMITAALTWGGLYLAGYHRSPAGGATGDIDVTAPGSEGETQLWTCGMHPMIITEEPGLCPICNMELTPKREDAGSSQTSDEKKIAYWKAPMNPREIYDEPGKSAMGMDLVPVYENELVGGVNISIDPVTVQNMGVRTATARKGPLVHTIRTYGHITYDETLTARISPKFSGWFEKLYVNFAGEHVQKGEPLFEIFSPDLMAAQEEYLSAFRTLNRSGGGNRALLASAARRLRIFGVADSEIKAIEQANQVKKRILIRSPFTGVVTDKNAVEGGYVKEGTVVYNLADLSRIWVEAHIYEYELDRVKKGQDVEMTLPYHPGKTYRGRVAFIYPYLQQKTRDVVIRLEFENPDMELKPDMYADVRIETRGEQEGIIIPSEAVIRSGERNVVFVTREKGKFSPREVTLGMALDEGNVQILSGIAPNEQVVTSGQFLLDSESKLKEAVQKMMEVKPSGEETEKEKGKGNKEAKDKGKKAEPEDGFFEDMPSSDDDNDFFNDMEETQ